MVWDGDLLLFTDAAGIYIAQKLTENTATLLGNVTARVVTLFDLEELLFEADLTNCP